MRKPFILVLPYKRSAVKYALYKAELRQPRTVSSCYSITYPERKIEEELKVPDCFGKGRKPNRSRLCFSAQLQITSLTVSNHLYIQQQKLSPFQLTLRRRASCMYSPLPESLATYVCISHHCTQL